MSDVLVITHLLVEGDSGGGERDVREIDVYGKKCQHFIKGKEVTMIITQQ